MIKCIKNCSLFSKCFNYYDDEFSCFHENTSIENIDIDIWNSIICSEYEKLQKMKMILNNNGENIHKFFKDAFYLYKKTISFHNHIHILDVLQLGCCLIRINKNQLKNATKLDIFTYFITLIIHDIGHIGLTNKDIIDNYIFINDIDDFEDHESSGEDSTSTMYSYTNDNSINELNHITLGYYLLQKHNIRINKEFYGKLIAYTDLQVHSVFLKKDLIYYDILNKNIHFFNIDNIFILFIKLADIGHILPPWNTHFKFVCNLNKERNTPLTFDVLIDDTINFNTTFVLPLVISIEKINVDLHKKLLDKYLTNINHWFLLKEHIIK